MSRETGKEVWLIWHACIIYDKTKRGEKMLKPNSPFVFISCENVSFVVRIGENIGMRW